MTAVQDTKDDMQHSTALATLADVAHYNKQPHYFASKVQRPSTRDGTSQRLCRNGKSQKWRIAWQTWFQMSAQCKSFPSINIIDPRIGIDRYTADVPLRYTGAGIGVPSVASRPGPDGTGTCKPKEIP